MCRAVGLPVPSPVSSHRGSSVFLLQCVIHSLVSNTFSCMDLYSYSVFYSFWLHFLSGLWTWLIILPCLELSRTPDTTPALPKSFGTAAWLVRALPCLSCGQPQLIHPHGMALLMLSLPQSTRTSRFLLFPTWSDFSLYCCGGRYSILGKVCHHRIYLPVPWIGIVVWSICTYPFCPQVCLFGHALACSLNPLLFHKISHDLCRQNHAFYHIIIGYILSSFWVGGLSGVIFSKNYMFK